jgi:hypothetical protein
LSAATGRLAVLSSSTLSISSFEGEYCCMTMVRMEVTKPGTAMGLMFGVWYGGGMVNTIRPSRKSTFMGICFPDCCAKRQIVSKSKATVKYILFIFSYLSVLLSAILIKPIAF